MFSNAAKSTDPLLDKFHSKLFNFNLSMRISFFKVDLWIHQERDSRTKTEEQ